MLEHYPFVAWSANIWMISSVISPIKSLAIPYPVAAVHGNVPKRGGAYFPSIASTSSQTARLQDMGQVFVRSVYRIFSTTIIYFLRENYLIMESSRFCFFILEKHVPSAFCRWSCSDYFLAILGLFFCVQRNWRN